MKKSNRGKDFLFSDDCGFINGDDGESYKYSDGSGYYHGADGSEGYIYSDGSGYYHGADGSDGYIYSDGSGYYHGADGSDGYIYSDGSGYYYGADGDEGHRYSDGSGYYNSMDGTCLKYEASEKSTSTEKEDTGFSSDINFRDALNALYLIYAEKERQERKEKKERHRVWKKKHQKLLFIVRLILAIVLCTGLGYYELQRIIPVGYDSSELIGITYEKAIDNLKKSGFTFVKTKVIEDLSVEREDESGLVTEVNLGLSKSFDKHKKYPSNFYISVVYHTLEMYRAPMNSKDAKGKNYKNVIEEFKDAGFTNIEINVEYDVITGWISEEGEVKSVVIDGISEFDTYDDFRPDAEVLITYHDLKKNK